MSYPLEQRKVVDRVAVKPRLLERPKVAALGLEPRFESLHLAFTKTRDVRDLARELAVARFRLGGDQVLDAELARDGRGNEAVGRGDQDSQIGDVTPYELPRRIADHRQDFRLHELTVPGVQYGAWVPRKRLQLKIE